MKKLFPDFGDKNIKLYYLLTVFLNGWFILPNWVFYFANYITIPQIGFIDGISKLVAVILEVPSGAVSDLLGKKKTLILGNLVFALCNIVLVLANNFLWLLIGNIIMFIGFAFISGAKEAILYDSLVDIKKEDEYDEVLGKVNSIATATTIFAIFSGGLLYRFDPSLPFVAWLVFNVIAAVILLFMREPYFDKDHISYSTYLAKLNDGVKSIFRKPFISFVLPVLFLSMLIKAYEGVIRQNTGAYFGFTGETFGYMLAIIWIPTLIVSFNYGKLSKWLKAKQEYLFVGLYLIGFLIVYLTNNLYFGVVSFLSIYVAQELTKPFIASLINKNTESGHRATAISTVSLFSELPYMVIVIFLGGLLTLDKISWLYAGYIVVLLIYILLRILKKKV